MRKELKDAIANLVRHYARLRIDHFHLLGMVLLVQKGKPLPESVIKELRMLRDRPESKEQLEETEETLRKVFLHADEDAMTQLLTEFLKKDDSLPN
jgi:hypothetical protein